MLFIPVEDLAPGDYSPEYGTIDSLTKTKTKVHIKFVNGKSITPSVGTELEVTQGGRFDRPVVPEETPQ